MALEVNLKKASEYSRQAKELSNNTAVAWDANFSILLGADAVVNAAKDFSAKAVENGEKKLQLLDVHFQIRQLLGKANAEQGIDALVNRREYLRLSIKTLNALAGIAVKEDTNPRARYYGNVAEPVAANVDDVSVIQKKIEITETQLKDASRQVSDTIRIGTRSPELTEKYAKRAADLTFELTEVNDQLTAKNITTKITLSDEIVAVLRSARIVQ